MNYTDSTTEEAFSGDAATISTSSSEDASYTSAAGGGLWTTGVMSTLKPIVTDSLDEQIVTAGILMLVWLYVNFTNGSLWYVIRKEYSLHTPQYMVLVSYMVCDALFCNLTLLQMVPVVISNNIHVISDIVSRILTIFIGSFIYSSIHMVGILAYERYFYFINPLRYPGRFTKARIYAAVAAIYIFSFCMSLAIDLIEPRIPVATVLTYQASALASKINNIIFIFVYFIPSGTMSVVALIKLRLLISKHQAQVHPTESNVMKEDQSAVSGVIVKPIKKALKMVGLVSGSFWITLIPGFLIRVGLSASGVTWADTDYRTSLLTFVFSRVSYMLISLLSSVINPLIYISVLTELKEAVWKHIGIKRNNSVSRT